VRSISMRSSPPSSFLIFSPAGAAGRKSATAAAMTSTSASGRCSATAEAISAAVSTRTTRAPTGGGRWEGPETTTTSAPLRHAAAATSYPMRPEERFPR
jgi:hypothetical protein